MIFVATNAPGTYKYLATVNNGCTTASDLGWVIVVADDSKIEIIPSDTLLCEADTVCLTATGPVPDCVVWTNMAGDSIGSGAELCVVPAEGMNFYIASVPGLDCVIGDTATIKLSVQELAVEVLPSDTIVCQGDSVKLTANVVPDDAMADITWYDENGESIATGMMITVSPDTTGRFTFIAIADNGCVADTAQATITVVDTMKLVITPGDTILCAPDTLKLSVEGAGSDFVVWYDENGNSIDTGMMITVVPDYGIHTYIAQIPETDCVEGDTIMVKVLPDNLELALMPSDTLVCVGDSVVIVGQLEPNWTMAQITWYDEFFTPIATTDTLVDFPFAGINTYFAIADNGCVMDTAQVSVFGEQLELSITGAEGNICPGEEVQLLVTGCDDCTYIWEPAGSLDDPTVSDPIATPQETTDYTVSVMGQACVEELSTTVAVECLECPINRLFMPSAFTPNGDGNNEFVCLRSEDFDRFD